MKTVKRNISFEEMHQITRTCTGIEGLNGSEKIAINHFVKKVERIYEDDFRDLEMRRAAALDAGVTNIPLKEGDDPKKEVELDHAEISAIASCFLVVFNHPKFTAADSELILKLSQKDCLNIIGYIESKITTSKVELIALPKEDERGLIPENDE